MERNKRNTLESERLQMISTRCGLAVSVTQGRGAATCPTMRARRDSNKPPEP